MDNTYYFAVNAMIDGKKQSQSGLVIAPNLASAAQRVTNRFSVHDLTDIEIMKKSEGVELFLYGDGFQTKGKIQNEKTDFVSNLNNCCGNGDCHCHDTKKEAPKKSNRTNVRVESGDQLDEQFADLTSLLNSLFSN